LNRKSTPRLENISPKLAKTKDYVLQTPKKIQKPAKLFEKETKSNESLNKALMPPPKSKLTKIKRKPKQLIFDDPEVKQTENVKQKTQDKEVISPNQTSKTTSQKKHY